MDKREKAKKQLIELIEKEGIDVLDNISYYELIKPLVIEAIKNGNSYRQIARKFGVSRNFGRKCHRVVTESEPNV